MKLRMFCTPRDVYQSSKVKIPRVGMVVKSLSLAIAAVIGAFVPLMFSGVAQASTVCTPQPLATFLNGSFEDPLQNSGGVYVIDGLVPGWHSTDSTAGQPIELWIDGFIGENASEGQQFLELEATDAATVYQDFATTPGQVISWSFDLSPRLNSSDVAETYVKIGPSSGALVDQGLQRANVIGWTAKSGTYVVPAGQTLTRFAFFSDPATFQVYDANLQRVLRGETHIDNVVLTTPVCVEVANSQEPLLALTGQPTGQSVFLILGLLFLGGSLVVFGRRNQSKGR